MKITQYLGDIYAVLTACTWSIAVVFFKWSGNYLEPIPLKVLQNTLAIAGFFLSIWIFQEPIWLDLTWTEWIRLLVSAILGISLGDTFYAAAINRVELGLIALIDGLYLPLVMVMAYFILGEVVSKMVLIGAVFVLTAVFLSHSSEFWIFWKSKGQQNSTTLLGIFYGVLSQVSMAACVVMIKDLLPRFSILTLTAYRFLLGNLFLIFIYTCRGRIKWIFSGFRMNSSWRVTLPGALLGPFTATLFWFGGFKYTLAGKAAVYNQLGLIFMVILGVYFLNEKLTRIKILALLLALLGTVCVFLD